MLYEVDLTHRGTTPGIRTDGVAGKGHAVGQRHWPKIRVHNGPRGQSLAQKSKPRKITRSGCCSTPDPTAILGVAQQVG